MIFNQCPICGRYMIPNMSETSGWYQCVCGYDSRSYVYTYTNHSPEEITVGIASTPTYTLISELERRGYNVSKKRGKKDEID